MVDKDNVLVLNRDGKVTKKINRYYRIDHIPIVQNWMYFSGVSCPYIDYFEVLESREIRYSYSYIEGVPTNDLSKELLLAIDNLVTIERETNLQGNNIVSFFEKIDFYCNNIDWKKVDRHVNTYVGNLITHYQDAKRIYQCDTLMHGDLDLNNIICSRKNYHFIDFDECCMAPEQMDWIIFWIRFLKNKSNENEKRVFAIKQLSQFDYLLIEAYFLKVITEKLYLEQKHIIDISEEEQKIDSYISWIYLLREMCKIWRLKFET